MSFDGVTVKEREGSSVEELIKVSADLGSKWFFNPFHIITTIKGRVRDFYGMNCLYQNKSIKTVQNVFKKYYDLAEKEKLVMGCDEFCMYIKENEYYTKG